MHTHTFVLPRRLWLVAVVLLVAGLLAASVWRSQTVAARGRQAEVAQDELGTIPDQASRGIGQNRDSQRD